MARGRTIKALRKERDAVLDRSNHWSITTEEFGRMLARLEANFSRANLAGVDMRDLDLRGCYFVDAYCGGADFRGADLEDTRFQGANLHGASGIFAAYGAGSERRLTVFYMPFLNGGYSIRVNCGCQHGLGLDSFRARIVDTYGPDSPYPRADYRRQYHALIKAAEAVLNPQIKEAIKERRASNG